MLPRFSKIVPHTSISHSIALRMTHRNSFDSSKEIGFLKTKAGLLAEKIFSNFINIKVLGLISFASEADVGSMPLHQNVILNEDSASTSQFTHMEITSDHVRLEFASPTDEYKQFARLMYLPPEEQKVARELFIQFPYS